MQFFTYDQRGASESDEGRFGQGVSHVQGQRVVLAPVGLVRHHDDVRAVGQFRVLLALLGDELLDQREDEPMVFLQHWFQVGAGVGRRKR